MHIETALAVGQDRLADKRSRKGRTRFISRSLLAMQDESSASESSAQPDHFYTIATAGSDSTRIAQILEIRRDGIFFPFWGRRTERVDLPSYRDFPPPYSGWRVHI